MAAAAATEIGHFGRRLRDSLRRKNIIPPAHKPMIKTPNRCQIKIALRKLLKKVGFQKKAHLSQTSERLLDGSIARAGGVAYPTHHVLNLCRRLVAHQRDQRTNDE